MVNRNSIYVLNKKDPDAIVYPSANGKPIRITRVIFRLRKNFSLSRNGRTRTSTEEEKLDHQRVPITLSPLMSCQKQRSLFQPRMLSWSDSTAETKNAGQHQKWS